MQNHFSFFILQQENKLISKDYKLCSSFFLIIRVIVLGAMDWFPIRIILYFKNKKALKPVVLQIIIACCGQYLKESGIDTVLFENKIFGIDVVKSVMNGKHCSHGKRGMLISEAMLQIMLSEFSKESNEKQQNFQQLYQQVETLQNITVNNFEIDDLIKEELDKCEQLSDEYVTSLNEFISQGNRTSHLFKYWSNFLINVVIILRDFTMHFRQANWLKHAGSEKSNTTFLHF